MCTVEGKNIGASAPLRGAFFYFSLFCLFLFYFLFFVFCFIYLFYIVLLFLFYFWVLVFYDVFWCFLVFFGVFSFYFWIPFVFLRRLHQFSLKNIASGRLLGRFMFSRNFVVVDVYCVFVSEFWGAPIFFPSTVGRTKTTYVHIRKKTRFCLFGFVIKFSFSFLHFTKSGDYV